MTTYCYTVHDWLYIAEDDDGLIGVIKAAIHVDEIISVYALSSTCGSRKRDLKSVVVVDGNQRFHASQTVDEIMELVHNCLRPEHSR